MLALSTCDVLVNICNFSKVVQTWWCFANILTWKYALRHNGVHFFNIATSEKWSDMVCFVHFDFEMCFAPQRCALFRHLNFQKCSEPGFDLEMCFAPQRHAVFHLSSGQMAPNPPTLASLLFDPQEPHTIGKTQCFATFLPFCAPASSFF